MRRILKTVALASYVLILLAMAAATIVEKWWGSAIAHSCVYGSWWFVLLWALLAASGLLLFFGRRVARPAVLGVHMALAIIMLGALLTRVLAVQGVVRLRVGNPPGSIFLVREGGGYHGAQLPFSLSLLQFDVVCRDGSSTPADYRSLLLVSDDEGSREAVVSMNNIYSHKGYRLCQLSYDPDMLGATLAVNRDPWGIAVTYCGYALLFLSLFWLIVDPHGTFRRRLRDFSPSVGGPPAVVRGALRLVLLAAFLLLSYVLARRWIIGGHVPLSNVYETALVVAWWTMLITLLPGGRRWTVLVSGVLVSGFFLLMSRIGIMDSSIGSLTPVLDSPLLALHVSLVIVGYALLSLTFFSSLAGLLLRSREGELSSLGRLLLYPAVAFLAAGIFVGAIWANISWGSYWSWDAKETWALITLMVYVVPLHAKALLSPRPLHVYLVLAFVSVLMTYFGVTFLLGGLHSYA